MLVQAPWYYKGNSSERRREVDVQSEAANDLSVSRVSYVAAVIA